MENDRPKLNIPLSTLDRGLVMLSGLALLCTWVYTFIQYQKLPSIIATHFNTTGQADKHGSKIIVFLLPAIITIVYAGLSILTRYPHIFNYPIKITIENALQQYTLATRLLRIIQLVIAIFSLFIMVDMVQSAQSGYSKLRWYVIPIFIFSMILPIVVSVFVFNKQKK